MLYKECEEGLMLHTLVKILMYNIVCVIFFYYNLYCYIFSVNRKKQYNGHFKKKK